MQTIYQMIERQARETPTAIAIAAPGRKPLTYEGLQHHIQHIGQTLNAMGVGRNERVAIILPNGPEMAVAFLAVAASATSAPLNPAYGADEFDFYLTDLEAKALLKPAGATAAATAVAQKHDIPIIEVVSTPETEAGIFALTGPDQTATGNTGVAQPDDVALVLHTSGTTSRPKIVPLTQTNLCQSAHNIRQTLHLTNNDRCLNIMPLFHIHGLIGAVLSSLAAGASIICTPGFEADQFFTWLADFSPTWYTAVPTMHQAILTQAATNQNVIKQRPLRFIRSSSASLPPPVMDQLERTFNAPVIESYGMTEASHQMASNPLPPQPRKPGSGGLPAGPQVKIMDEQGHLLPAGQTGEVVIRGPNVTLGYQNNPTANQNAFINSWFRTGDEGYFDEDGYLFLTGRLKEMINRGGEKIAPREIDEVLMAHPAVTQAATFAVPHATLGEDVAAAVVLKPQATITETELRELTFAHLADFKVPSRIIMVDHIPKGATGKLQRIGLAEKLTDNLKIDHVAPRNDVEQALANIWSDVLQLEQIGVYDNFFYLGGDSLKATQVSNRIRTAFQVQLPLGTIFRKPTIEGQAQRVEELLLREIGRLTDTETNKFLE